MRRPALNALPARERFALAHRVSAVHRMRARGQRDSILWFTGLSGAGRSTLAIELQKALFSRGYQVYTLNGDNVRQGLFSDLGFCAAERAENIRRIGEVAALFAEAGVVAITAFISPYRAERDAICARHPGVFHEVYIDSPLGVCEAREVKGLYRRARAGEIAKFTGVSAPYEPPLDAELVLAARRPSMERCVNALLEHAQRELALHAECVESSTRRARVAA